MIIRCEKCRAMLDPNKDRPIQTIKTAGKVTEKYKCPKCKETFIIIKESL
ncbi:MAG: hypothetical protein JW969_19780 [Spirochaetales bacterium]|nr:hypothetical protein [Spirochaetales bacterium]